VRVLSLQKRALAFWLKGYARWLSPAEAKLVMGMVEAGTALCVPGNHDMKLLQKLRDKDVKIAHGLADSIAQLEVEPPEFKSKVADFLDGLISHYVLDDGKLVVAHSGMREEMQGRGSGAIRSFALFGETTGETDEFGLPVRYDWAADYRGKASVVYGHTPIAEPQWLNRTVNIGHGMRVWRQADHAPLPRERVCLRVGSQDLLRAREALGVSTTDYCFVPAARAGRCPRH
jgi:hypothetical protein